MPRPYSADLRERALLACEADEGSFTAVARRFRVGVSTLRLWRKQARKGQRAPRPLGRGPVPLGGDLLLLNELVAERNDATLAEYGAALAARTGKPRCSAPTLCRALKRLGWVRKQKRSGPASSPKRAAFAAGIAWTWQRAALHGAPRPLEGLLVGISSGATLAAIAKTLPAGATVLGFNYDTGERYLSVPDFLPG